VNDAPAGHIARRRSQGVAPAFCPRGAILLIVLMGSGASFAYSVLTQEEIARPVITSLIQPGRER
jgi:hypothetical protein